jgi:hypothetical protein
VQDERWRVARRAVHTRTPSGGVVLDTTAKAYWVLNATGESLWKALESGASRPELVARLRQEFEVDDATASRDVDTWLSELSGAHLIEEDRAGG